VHDDEIYTFVARILANSPGLSRRLMGYLWCDKQACSSSAR